MARRSGQRYEVIVGGGGPAGIGAAIAAARAGARTLLIERLGHLGGMHTGAGVNVWCDSFGGPIFDELMARLGERGACTAEHHPERFAPIGRRRTDTELCKLAALDLLHQAGAETLFMTHCERASVRDGRVNGVWVVNKGGRRRLSAEVVIDCTADADLAASAGAAFELGNPGDGRLQHVNYRYWLEGVDGEKYQREKPDPATLEALCRAAVADGRLRPPSQLFQPQVESFPYNQRSRTLCAVNWELAGVDPTDPVAVSRTLTECQVAVWHLLPFLRTLPGFEQCKLRKLPEVLGIRESRRIAGLARLTAEDVVQARKYPDGIARACFYMDLHDSPPGLVVPHETAVLQARRPPHGDWYEIRYGCLVPRDLTGLLVAGRCISADRDAHGSARVMPTCMFLGTAAGTAAALALRQGTLPHTLDGRAVRAQLGPHFGG